VASERVPKGVSGTRNGLNTGDDRSGRVVR